MSGARVDLSVAFDRLACSLKTKESLMFEIQKVKLTEDEQRLYDATCWDTVKWMNEEWDHRFAHMDRVAELAESLFSRKVIPQHRLDYFLEPDQNAGGYGRSRKQVFESNDTSGREILRHPHFVPYLKYFIFGPDLPESTIDGFTRIIEDDCGTSGMVLDEICAYVRKEVREKNLSLDAPDEFFKLALEVDRPSLATTVRDAAKKARSSRR